MRFAVLVAVFSLISVTAHSEEAAASRTTSCAQAASDLDFHKLGCLDEDMYILMPDNEDHD
ncbi:hypothetical protein [Methylobacterium longum]|uniref:Uncharacterized protein n=1 Tax=Methylobacterium longum TaxID=767694 RepID=A0ABT8ALD6_9HYPH|nr:hypothetical protein [Methylobacterium longum]MDN3570260.1 hypothetical protein [Methylobacterium longum]